MHISEKIKFIRTKILNVSAQKFADMCGVTARTVYAWESGVSLPCLDNIVAIANTCHYCSHSKYMPCFIGLFINR